MNELNPCESASSILIVDDKSENLSDVSARHTGFYPGLPKARIRTQAAVPANFPGEYCKIPFR